jgi:hypothetical protein
MFAALHAFVAPLLAKLFLCCFNFWDYLLATHSASFIMFSSPLLHPVGNLFFEFAAYGGESEMKIVGTPHAPARDFVPCTPEMRVYEALSYAPLFFSA